MPKISIVVPVYKVEPYLDRCVESLRAQTLSDLEIILVDDGSPDRCPQMCDEWAEKDERIRVVHKENGGLSSARNAGLAIASGKYIGFVDSDDDVEPDMYEKMAAVSERYEVDFTQADYLRIDRAQRRSLHTERIAGGLYEKEQLRQAVYPALIMGENLEYGPLLSVWCCLYRRTFLDRHGLRFAEDVRWSEDNLFSAMAGYCAERFYYMKGEGLYHYYQNPGTITTAYRRGAWDVYRTMNRRLHAYFDPMKDAQLENQMQLHLIFYACNCIGMEATLPKGQAVRSIRGILETDELKRAFRALSRICVPAKLRMQLLLMKHGQARLLYGILRRRTKRSG